MSDTERWIVVCRGDRVGVKAGDYELATRTVFRSAMLAEQYAQTIARSRRPIVARCPLGVDLRDDAEMRFAQALPGRTVAS